MNTQDLSARNNILINLIGKPWEANAKGPDAFDCWHLAVHVEQALFNLGLPDMEVPKDVTWRWMIDQFTNHEEHKNWQEVPYSISIPVCAKDGAIVLMARSNNPAHCGVWLKREARIIHADQAFGVSCQDIQTLRMAGWAKLRFYEHI